MTATGSHFVTTHRSQDTDLHDEAALETTDAMATRRRLLALAGIGAGIAATGVVSARPAHAADGDNVVIGTANTGNTSTSLTGPTAAATLLAANTATGVALAGPANALKGQVLDAANGSHAILGTTAGEGHAVAGVIGTATDSVPAKTVAATWGRHYGTAAAVEGENLAANVAVAGPANGVKGRILNATNGSHAVLGTTVGGGHAVAGVIGSVDGAGVITVQTATVAATWGRHYGLHAGVEGENRAKDVPLAGAANGVRGTVNDPSNGSHAILGVTAGAGHSVAGDTPAGSNTTAATWGRHGGAGAGIGGVSANGYGGEFVGGRASVRLIPSAGVAAGAPTATDSKRGELVVDANGALFYNTADGASFTRLDNQTVLLADAQRAVDTRAGRMPKVGNQTKLAAGETRTIDLTAATDFPAGAKGAIVNITVTETDTQGYLTVFNGDSSTRPLASTINWTEPNTTLANGVTLRVGAAGTVKVFASRGTHLLIDVVGFLA